MEQSRSTMRYGNKRPDPQADWRDQLSVTFPMTPSQATPPRVPITTEFRRMSWSITLPASAVFAASVKPLQETEMGQTGPVPTWVENRLNQSRAQVIDQLRTGRLPCLCRQTSTVLANTNTGCNSKICCTTCCTFASTSTSTSTPRAPTAQFAKVRPEIVLVKMSEQQSAAARARA